MTHGSEQSTTFNPETLHILGSALDDALAASRGPGSPEW